MPNPNKPELWIAKLKHQTVSPEFAMAGMLNTINKIQDCRPKIISIGGYPLDASDYNIIVYFVNTHN